MSWNLTSGPHGELTYNPSQVLSGHGQLQTYMAKLGKAQADICVLCASGMKNEVERRMLHCQALNGVRDKPAHRNVSAKGSVKEMVKMIMKSMENWKKFMTFSDDIMIKQWLGQVRIG